MFYERDTPVQTGLVNRQGPYLLLVGRDDCGHPTQEMTPAILLGTFQSSDTGLDPHDEVSLAILHGNVLAILYGSVRSSYTELSGHPIRNCPVVLHGTVRPSHTKISGRPTRGWIPSLVARFERSGQPARPLLGGSKLRIWGLGFHS